MTYVPHTRITMSGTLPGGEIFSMNLAWAQQAGPGTLAWFFNAGPNDNVFNEAANNLRDWFSRPATKISAAARLKLVKFSPIGEDGHYAGVPVERAFDEAGGVITAAYSPPPNQVARALTLYTNGDLGRVRGRIYVPMPALPVQSDGRWSAADADAMEASDQTMINGLNNQPGIDVLDLRVVVASQGRHNKNGTQRRAPANDVVNAISVGRVPDTIRRRRNKLAEAKTTVPVA